MKCSICDKTLVCGEHGTLGINTKSIYDDFSIICQESWETIGYATQMDERVINLIWKKLTED